MISIHVKQLPVSESELRAALAAYRSAMAAHSNTQGVAAPFPDHKEFFDRVLADADHDFTVQADPPAPAPPTTLTQLEIADRADAAADRSPALALFLSQTSAEGDAWVDERVAALGSQQAMVFLLKFALRVLRHCARRLLR